MAAYASSEEGEAILQFVARDFDEAADGLENNRSIKRQRDSHSASVSGGFFLRILI